jgi:hypothetical protein
MYVFFTDPKTHFEKSENLPQKNAFKKIDFQKWQKKCVYLHKCREIYEATNICMEGLYGGDFLKRNLTDFAKDLENFYVAFLLELCYIKF